MASSIPLHEYATPDQRAAEIPAPEDSGASSTAVAETGLNTPAPGGQLPAASDTTRDSVPIRDAAQVPGESVPATDKTPPKPFWKKNSFWNKVLTPTNTLLTVINFAPTFMTRTVDDRRLALDYSKARGEQWSRDIVFRQQCEKDRDASIELSPECLDVLSRPAPAPPDFSLRPELAGGMMITVSATPATESGTHAALPRRVEIDDQDGGTHDDPNAVDHVNSPSRTVPARYQPDLTREEKQHIFWFKKYAEFNQSCAAEKEANHELSAACIEVMDVWQRLVNLDPDLSMSEATMRAISDRYRRKVMARLPAAFRRATEERLEACAALILIGLASYLVVVAYNARSRGMATAVTEFFEWRFVDPFDARSWATWGTGLGIVYHSYGSAVMLPDESWPVEQEASIFGLAMLVRILLVIHFVPWVISWASVYLVRGVFSRRWKIEAPWQLDDVYLGFRESLWTGLQCGIFWASLFGSVLYMTGYWGSGDVENILQEEFNFYGIDLKW